MHEPAAPLLRCALWLPTDCQPPYVFGRPDNERIVLAEDVKSLVPKLALDNLERHLMSMLRFACTRSPIYNHQATTRPKRLKYTIEDRFRTAEFVIGVTDEHGVHGTYWQAWIVFFVHYDVNIALASQQRP